MFQSHPCSIIWPCHVLISINARNYNRGQNYVGQACRMHCLDHRSVFHLETNVLWAKSYHPPLPPCNVVHEERLADESSNIVSGAGGGGGGRKGGSERILQQFGKRALCPTHFGQDCRLNAGCIYFFNSSYSFRPKFKKYILPNHELEMDLSKVVR